MAPGRLVTRNRPRTLDMRPLNRYNTQCSECAGRFCLGILGLCAAFCGRRYALVAQLDRVTDYESVGRGFESLPSHQEAQIREIVSALLFCIFNLPPCACRAKTTDFMRALIPFCLPRASLTHREMCRTMPSKKFCDDGVKKVLPAFLAFLDTESERQQFTEIYERYKRLVYYNANKRLQDNALAEDIVQEVFLYIAENFQQIPVENGHKVARYLVLASRGRALNLLKKRCKETVDDERLSVESGNESEIPENAAVDLSQAGKIIEQVARLDEIYRIPMELLARGYSSAEIAGLLGLPEPTVRKRIERGRKQLWEELTQNDGNRFV